MSFFLYHTFSNISGRTNDLSRGAPIYTTGLQCTGTERSILDCNNWGWYQIRGGQCGMHTLDAGVQCFSSG